MKFVLKRAFYFVVDNWRAVGIVAGIFLLLVLIIWGVRACNRPPAPKIDEAEIQRGEQAIRDRNRAELEQILTTVEVREREIDANVAGGEWATKQAEKDARDRYGRMTIEELRAEFEKRRSEK